MSTSDAGELEREVVGGERTSTLSARTTTEREQRDESLVEKKSHQSEGRSGDLQLHQSGSRWEDTNKDAVKQDDRFPASDSDLQTGPPHELRFTSSLFLRLSSRIKNRKLLDSGQRSLTEPQTSESSCSTLQVNEGVSSSHTSIRTSVHSSSICVPREGPLLQSSPGKEKDCSLPHRFLNGDLPTEEPHRVHSCASLPGTHPGSLTGSVLEGDVRVHKPLGGLEGLSDDPSRMLSSTVVTVLAPPWTGRIRRPKKNEGPCDSQGNVQDPLTDRSPVGFQESLQYGGEASSAGGSQIRRPLMGLRSNTVGWSTKADPSLADSHRKLTQTVSLDVNTVKMDTGPVSPLAAAPCPALAFLLDQNEQRNNLQANQAQLSALSSKPTTSSLLLSLRRINSSSRSSNTATSTLSDASTSPTKQNTKPFCTQDSLNKNEQKRPKPAVSPSSLSYRRTETEPVCSPSSYNQREVNKSDTFFFSAPPIIRESDSTPLNKTQSPPAFLSKPQPNYKSSNKGVNLLSATSVSAPRSPSYDQSCHRKPPSVPRTTLTSTSWWKQVTQEGNSTFARGHPTNITGKPHNTPLTPPHDRRGLGSKSPTDNERFSQIHGNRDNNNMTESLYKSNMKTQGGAANIKQRNAENPTDLQSGWLVTQPYGSNLNRRQQKTSSIPCVSFTSKMSRASSLTTLSHLKDSNQRDASPGPAELPPPLQGPRSPNTPTMNNHHHPPESNSPPTSHVDSQKFIRPSLSPDFTSTTSGPSPASNTKSTFSFYPLSSRANIQNCSSQTLKSTDKVVTTPLGFERNYASIPKAFQSKSVSSLMPAVPSSSKTSCNSTTTSVTSSPVATGYPVATAPPPHNSSITPASTASPTLPSSISSLLTPPTTPNTTNTTSPKGVRTFSNSLERDPKNNRADAKRARRVTWDESVDLQCSEFTKIEKRETPPGPTTPRPPLRTPQYTPFIFSFLRSGSTTCSPDTKNSSSTQPGKGGKYRSLSSDAVDSVSRECEKSKQRNGDIPLMDQQKHGTATPKQERTLSVESGSAQCHSSAALSLPPDFPRNYKLRYSSPPYSTLMSSRLAQGETKPVTPRSPLFPQPTQSHYSISSKTDKTVPSSKPPLSPTKAFQLMPLPFPKLASTPDTSKCDQVNTSHDSSNTHAPVNHQVQLVNNRVNFGSQSLQGDRSSHSSSFVTETLIYSIRSKVDPAPAALQSITPITFQPSANTADTMETKLSQNSHTEQSQEAAAEPRGHSDQSSSGSSSADSQSQGGSGGRMKDGVLGKSRFFSVDIRNEHSPKKSRFALKKSVSTPSASLTRSESERVSKTGNRMDQVLNKLRQKFSTKRQDDDPSFPWKWRRGSQTPSVSSDISNLSDHGVEIAKPPEERVQPKDMSCNGAVKKNTDDEDRWTQNRYTIIPSSTVEITGSGDQFSGYSEKSASRTDPQEPSPGSEEACENKVQLRVHSPTLPHFDSYQDNSTDYKTPNQLVPCRDPSPCRSPNASSIYPVQFRKSTPSPRSPFSPFASLSPVSPFPAADPADDNVFYSPKLQRRRDTQSPQELGDAMNLGATRKSRASTGAPSVSPGQDTDLLASSYADLKYGIEPSKSFSVSSVLSSRPSGPGRISTGSRFMSVGDLSHSTLSCGDNGGSLDPWSAPPDGASDSGVQPVQPHHLWCLTTDPGKFRSRSLPRSLTKCLANWRPEGFSPQPLPDAKPPQLRTPSVDIRHFTWEPEGPPTPPPTPPLSPVSRRMSKPPGLSSPTFPCSSGALQQERAHQRSRGYVSSLSTFEESSDSSSDTTTDDEYYLEGDEAGEKETEL